MWGGKAICIEVILGILLMTLLQRPARAQEVSLAFYGARLTNEKWEEALLPDADYADATIVVGAASWTLVRFFDERAALEMEAVVGKYSGDQDHWEFNLPIFGIRWLEFPWNHWVTTSLAYGIGPSYATRVPEVELANNTNSSHWLTYWFAEVTVGMPAANWEVLMRLHHRSDAFSTVAEDGGSNAIGAGLRYHF